MRKCMCASELQDGKDIKDVSTLSENGKAWNTTYGVRGSATRKSRFCTKSLSGI